MTPFKPETRSYSSYQQRSTAIQSLTYLEGQCPSEPNVPEKEQSVYQLMLGDLALNAGL